VINPVFFHQSLAPKVVLPNTKSKNQKIQSCLSTPRILNTPKRLGRVNQGKNPPPILTTSAKNVQNYLQKSLKQPFKPSTKPIPYASASPSYFSVINDSSFIDNLNLIFFKSDVSTGNLNLQGKSQKRQRRRRTVQQGTTIKNAHPPRLHQEARLDRSGCAFGKRKECQHTGRK
jgi:hypothetical protein